LAAAREANAAKGDWIARALGRAGAVPPAEVDAALAQGRVRIDGRVVTKPFAPVPEGARVTVDGIAVDVGRRTRVLMLNKPKGVVSAGRDRRGTVFDVLQGQLDEALARYSWHAVGRLDVDTTGLLLFTNDERFVAHGTSPERHLPKRYLATVHEKATDAMLEPLRKGITLDDGPARPAKARVREKGRVELTLTEGRHHQVKRMLAAVGLPVLALHREAVGGLVLDVPEGTFRELSEGEIREALEYGG
jgi:23S rRNA pseudouridine2605 synthase/16S rRNA pseudouridine516 synthase